MNIASILKTALMGASVLSLASAPVCADVIFTDNFEQNASGWYYYNSNSGGQAWGRADIGQNYLPLSNWTLRNNAGAQSNTMAYKQWMDRPVTLAKAGDSISVALDFRSISSPTSSALIIALFNTDYTFEGNVLGGSNPAADSDGYRYFNFWNAGSGVRFDSITDNATSTLKTIDTDIVTINDNLGHSLVYTLTRTVSGLKLDVTIGETTYSYLDTTATVFTFNSLYLQTGMGANFDNVSVCCLPAIHRRRPSRWSRRRLRHRIWA